jgi:orotidine-5'-phosphate decarboxylase
MGGESAKMNSPAPFADRLCAAVRAHGTPLIVGLDPRQERLPAPLRPPAAADGPAAAAESYRRFCRGIIDVVASLVPAVKPQAAFFEQIGPDGMAALFDVIAYARQQGLLVIYDGKRNDIGSTATAYAEGILGSQAEGGWGADALTVSPYLGRDSLEPFVDVCRRQGTGIFVLVKTSNPGGGMFQDLVSNGQPLYRHVAQEVTRINETVRGECGYGAVGAVVGATYPEQLAELRSEMPHCWLLVPGFGAQGGGAKGLVAAFDAQGLGAVINSSRNIIFAHSRDEYRQRFPENEWQRAVEAATRDAMDELRDAGVVARM